MRILFIGDVVGKPGRRAVASLVPALRQEREIDFVIANGENSAHGAGLTASTVDALLSSGVDLITTGDHVWDQKEIYEVIEREPRVLRPLNFPPATPGRGATVIQRDGQTPVGVMNLIGRVFMPNSDCPFRAAEAEVARLKKQTNIIIVDLHAEATSEKIAMGRFLDGKVSAVIGTHTHVATADERILPKGTAYISDVGMCGPHDSVLGREVEAVLKRFLTQMPQRMEVAEGDVALCGAIIDVDENSGRSRSIERIRIPSDRSE
ncbi:MAG TPA: TIGR00282 family metallophosphoesterase [Verrucomicrobiae bacterium]|nr:TIGR00282 family metallophosphoesterase [Verrucomicrobiae bacterium]